MKAFVLCNNDHVLEVVVGSKETAQQRLLEIEKDYVNRNRSTAWAHQWYFHLREVPCSQPFKSKADFINRLVLLLKEFDATIGVDLLGNIDFDTRCGYLPTHSSTVTAGRLRSMEQSND